MHKKKKKKKTLWNEAQGKKKKRKKSMRFHLRFPSVVLDHVGQFNNKFAFLVLLTRFECVLIFPAECGFTTLAINICDSVQSREQDTFLSRTATHIHHRIEEISSSLTALKRLGNEFVVIGQVSSAVDAWIGAVTTFGQVSLKCFHHSARILDRRWRRPVRRGRS